MKYSVTSKAIYTVGIALFLLILTEPALAAEFDLGKSLLEKIKGWMTGLGSVILTIALIVVGFRMAFQAAEWKDVAPVFWGGVIIGGAGVVAGILVPGGA